MAPLSQVPKLNQLLNFLVSSTPCPKFPLADVLRFCPQTAQAAANEGNALEGPLQQSIQIKGGGFHAGPLRGRVY